MFSIQNAVLAVRESHPLVHCITNYVTINDCANILLAIGASPIMADSPLESAEVTAICSGLVINTGTLHENTVDAMLLSGHKANAMGIPVILDPVGAGVSAFRRDTIKRLLSELHFSVIRGNLSEIKTLCDCGGCLRGVDANFTDTTEADVEEVAALTRVLAQKTGAVVAVTGATDIVSDADTSFYLQNGHPDMTKITGSGCMLSAVVGAFVSASPDKGKEAVVSALCMFGIAGEIAYEKTKAVGLGIGSMRGALMDAVEYLMENGETIERRAKIHG